MFSKFVDKFAQKSSIFSTKASFERGLFIIFLLALCYACSSAHHPPSNRVTDLKKWKEPNGKIKVLSTTAMLDDLVKEVGGEYVDTLSLITGELNPHTYQLVKGDDEKLNFSHLIFYNGLGLEHGPSLQRYLHESSKAISVGGWIKKNSPEQLLYDRGQVDPHIWMDVALWAKGVELIANSLSAIDPPHAETYRVNAAQLETKLMNLHREIIDSMNQLSTEKRYLITSHDAFNYFSRAYLSTEDERLSGEWRSRFAAPEGFSPDGQLSAADIQWILNYVCKHNVHVLFPESNVNKDSILKIISAGTEKGKQLKIAETSLYGDAMGPAGSDGDTYFKMMQHNAFTIKQYLADN